MAITSASVSHGLGRHVVHLQPHQISNTLYLSAILQPFSYVLPKLAVVMLIIKLMGPKKPRIWFLFSIFTILAIASALCAIFVFVQRDPPSHFWNPTEPAKCWPPNVLKNLTVFAGCESFISKRLGSVIKRLAWSAFVDLSLALFPMTVFWNLKIKGSRKIGIFTIMGLGIL